MDTVVVPFQKDDIVGVTKGKNVGEVDTIDEVDAAGRIKLRALGWYLPDALKLVQRPEPPQAIAQTVDGEPAKIVLSGTTGAPQTESNGSVESTIAELERQMDRQLGIVREAKDAKKEAAAEYKAQQEKLHRLAGDIAYQRRQLDERGPSLFDHDVKTVPANNRDAVTPPILGGNHGEEPSSIPAQRSSGAAESGTSGASQEIAPSDVVDENTNLENLETDIEPS